MKFLFQNETSLNTIELSSFVFPLNSRMSLKAGEGEKEIGNQGRSRVKSFSQETGAIGQHKPRIGDERPKLARELSARMRVDSSLTPHFFFSERPNGG